MNNPARLLIFLLIAVDLVLFVWLLLHGKTIAILQPRGIIALQERDLMITAILLMLIVVIPVLTLAFFVAWKYKANNTTATYTPEWNHHTKLQIFLWAFPTVIITILSIMNWVYAHRLDPHVALASSTKPLIIQVVALRWKWLFIYPEQHIATVNYVAFPEKTPITFELTGDDSPMNSFWIPQLGGQIYAMSGMATQTHLLADGVGTYRGSSAEISGQGFTGMRFTASSVSRHDFTNWIASVKQSPQILDAQTYSKLLQPSENTPPTFYSSTPPNLYTTIVEKYMAPSPTHAMQQMNSMEGM